MAPPIPGPENMFIQGTMIFADPTVVIIELLFTLIALTFCLAIYFKTRESYELTKYEGIKHFRYAFLFFGISYVLSFISSVALFSRVLFGLMLPREIFGPLFIIPLGYLSTMAILYLMYSSIWKNFDNKKTIIASHVVAIVLTIVAFITRSHEILVLLQLMLLIVAVILGFITSKHKKISQMKMLYFLVLGLWLMNLFTLSKGRPIIPGIEITFQIASIVAYTIIYYKISKWVK